MPLFTVNRGGGFEVVEAENWIVAEQYAYHSTIYGRSRYLEVHVATDGEIAEYTCTHTIDSVDDEVT